LETDTIWRSGFLIEFAWGMTIGIFNSSHVKACIKRIPIDRHYFREIQTINFLKFKLDIEEEGKY